MKVLTIILGALLIIAGVICMFSPGETFLATGIIIGIMLFVYGIIGTIGVIAKRISTLMLFATIPALIIGIIALVRPGSTFVIDAFMIYLFAAWFVVQGIMNIVVSVRSRYFTRGWGWGLALGIISTILGIYCFIHPELSALAIGILVGLFLIEAGIDLIVLAATAGRIEGTINRLGKVGEELGSEMRAAAADAEARAQDAQETAAQAAEETTDTPNEQ